MGAMPALGPADPNFSIKMYYSIMDAMPTSVLILDSDFRILSANRNFLEKSKKTLSDTVGSRLEEVFPEVILEQTDLVQQIKDVFILQEATRGQLMTYLAPGVKKTIYYYRIIPFLWNTQVKQVILLLEDVTEQMRLAREVAQVKDHLANVVDSASDIILSTDTRGQIISWNVAAEKLSGYHFKEVEGKSISGYFPELDFTKLKELYNQLKADESGITFESNLITKSGKKRQIYWMYSALEDTDAQLIGAVAVGRDFTERRRLELELLQSQKLAALGVMAGGIAHEIRNPLAICSSAAQFLKEGSDDPNLVTECAQKIVESVRRAACVVEDLLKFARPGELSGKQPIDVVKLVNETQKMVGHQARINRVNIKVDCPDAPLMVWGSSNLIRQVFVNMFLNAIEAMPDGGWITVVIQQRENDVVIVIRDTGRGIGRNNLSKVFDPFYTDSPLGKGIGLGLSICHSIIAQHKGTIQVASQMGKGAVFTIRMPVMQPECGQETT